MKIQTTLVAALLPALLTVGTAAQEAKPDASAKVMVKTQAKSTNFVMPAGETSIQDLVDGCATFLDINILINAQECAQGQAVKLQKQIVTDTDGCKDLLSGLLYRAGFALTSLNENLGLYEVIMMTGTRGREVMNRARHRTLEQVLQRPNLKVAVTVVVELKNINAQLANNALRPFFASTGGHNAGGSLMIGNVGSASSLLLSGMQDQVAQAIRMLRLCDVPQPERIVHAAARSTTTVKRLEKRIAALEKKIATKTSK
ncbi:MAG: hypothetical protein ACI89X_001106 [Planctomycetota bacterium]|jgi:hypothetical protein